MLRFEILELRTHLLNFIGNFKLVGMSLTIFCVENKISILLPLTRISTCLPFFNVCIRRVLLALSENAYVLVVVVQYYASDISKGT